jgi:hypothetical protein
MSIYSNYKFSGGNTPEMKRAAVGYAANSMRFARVDLAMMWIIPIICAAIAVVY